MSAPLAVFAAGSAMQAYSSYKQAQAQNAQARYQARAARFNADISMMEADYARKAAAKSEKQHRDNLSQFIGTQRARMGGSGFAVDSASYTDLIDSAAVMGEMDALTIRFEGELSAWRKEEEAKFLREQASAIESSQVDPNLALGASLLSSGASGARFF